MTLRGRKRQHNAHKTIKEESWDEKGWKKGEKRPWEEAAGLAVALRARLGTPPSSSSSPCKQLRAFNWFTISANDRSIYRKGGRKKSSEQGKNNTHHPECPHTSTPHITLHNNWVQTVGLVYIIISSITNKSASTNRLVKRNTSVNVHALVSNSAAINHLAGKVYTIKFTTL